MVNHLFHCDNDPWCFSIAVCFADDVVSPELDGDDDGQKDDGASYDLLDEPDFLDCTYDCGRPPFGLADPGLAKKEIGTNS